MFKTKLLIVKIQVTIFLLNFLSLCLSLYLFKENFIKILWLIVFL